MNSESILQNQIRVALSDIAILFRVPAGLYWAGAPGTKQRRVQVAIPGVSDLIGWRKSDGRFVAIEVKTETGRLREQQGRFLDAVRNCGGLAGVARSVQDAIEIVEGTE